MKEFKFKINGNDYKVNIKDFKEDLAHVEVNGAVYDVKVELKESKTPIIKSVPVVQSVMERSTLTQRVADKSSELKAPIPGIILKLMCKEGDKVKIGQTLLILEAMKMQNEIQASKDGVIKQIKVKENQSVFESEILIVIE